MLKLICYLENYWNKNYIKHKWTQHCVDDDKTINSLHCCRFCTVNITSHLRNWPMGYYYGILIIFVCFCSVDVSGYNSRNKKTEKTDFLLFKNLKHGNIKHFYHFFLQLSEKRIKVPWVFSYPYTRFNPWKEQLAPQSHLLHTAVNKHLHVN